MVSADYSLVAEEPAKQPSTEGTDDEPAIVTSLEEMTCVVEEPSTGTAMDISSLTEAQACDPEVGDVAAADVVDEPTVDGAVGTDEKNSSSNVEVVGEGEEGAPDAKGVDEVAVNMVHPEGTDGQPSVTDVEVEPVSDLVTEPTATSAAEPAVELPVDFAPTTDPESGTEQVAQREVADLAEAFADVVAEPAAESLVEAEPPSEMVTGQEGALSEDDVVPAAAAGEVGCLQA